MNRTTIASPEGGLGKLSASDMAFAAGYGRAVRESLSLGVGFKFIRESIDDVSVQGYALDIGGLYAPPAIPSLGLGVVIQNIGPMVKFQNAKENLPLNIRLGAAYGFSLLGQKNLFSLDITKQRSEEALVSFGAETVVAGMMPFRLGFNTRNKVGPGVSVGIGWLYKDFSVDYAFVPFGPLGNAHRISTTISWGGKPKSW